MFPCPRRDFQSKAELHEATEFTRIESKALSSLRGRDSDAFLMFLHSDLSH